MSAALDMQAILPSLRPRDGRWVHIAADPSGPAYCGYNGKPRHTTHTLEAGDKCSCGQPMCPTCLQIRQTWINSGGAWEGVE